MIIDVHTHTQEHSPCSHLPVAGLIRQARDVGLEGLVLTDHDYLWAQGDLATALGPLELGSPLVLRGQEVSCRDGHLLVYGVEAVLSGDPSRIEVAALVRGLGGATVLAHPFRWGGLRDQDDRTIADYFRRFDAVEVWTTNHSDEEIKRLAALGAREGIRLVAASDAHSAEHLGVYALGLPEPLTCEQDLVEALKFGQLTPLRRDASGAYVPLV